MYVGKPTCQYTIGKLANFVSRIILETGKNKRKTSQPYGKEAEAFTTDLVYHKMVKITFLRKDQYKRAVSQVETVEEGIVSALLPGYGPKDLSLELARAGLAELYTGGGAEYSGKRDELEKAIAMAKKEQKGIWSLENRVSAADYKRADREGVLPDNNTVSYNSKPRQQEAPMLVATLYDMPPQSETAKSVVRKPSPMRSFVNKRSVAHNLIDIAVTGLEIAAI